MKVINENYSVDEEGNVYSRPRAGTRGGLVKPVVSKTGYHVVMLSPSRVPVKVHRLVAEAFIPNQNNLPQVNHKDGNKLNNHVTNLEWCDNKFNINHAKDMGLMRWLKGENNHQSKLTDDAVRYIRSHYIPHSREFGTRALGIKFGVSHTKISDALRGESWNHVV